MSHPHQLLGAPNIMQGRPGSGPNAGMRRLNRLPIFIALGLVLVVLAVIVFGLSSRGLWRHASEEERGDGARSASSFAENLKRGVSDGIIGEPVPMPVASPPPAEAAEVITTPPLAHPSPPRSTHSPAARPAPVAEPEAGGNDWREKLHREHEEQILKEYHRQAMARLQRADGARSSPLRIDTRDQIERTAGGLTTPGIPEPGRGPDRARLSERLLAAAEAMGAPTMGLQGQDRQEQKQAFLERGRRGPGESTGLRNTGSPLTLARGSVIPAMLLTGINADLPGRILAQVSQNVYDSATGEHLLIPQGARLLGRYDSRVSYGQSRVLVVWTDILLSDGQSLSIGAMAGMDQEGQAGFKDKIDRHLFATFGSAALVALIGTGMDLTLPADRGSGFTDASDAARRSFSETFGRLAERTISKNIDVQPTLTIRPGYRFNVLVDQDLVFEAQ
jgi:type IV secretion system protein TrbI